MSETPQQNDSETVNTKRTAAVADIDSQNNSESKLQQPKKKYKKKVNTDKNCIVCFEGVAESVFTFKNRSCSNGCKYYTCIPCFLRMLCKNINTSQLTKLHHRCVLCRETKKIKLKRIKTITNKIGDFTSLISSIDKTDEKRYELSRKGDIFSMVIRLIDYDTQLCGYRIWDDVNLYVPPPPPPPPQQHYRYVDDGDSDGGDVVFMGSTSMNNRMDLLARIAIQSINRNT